MKSKLAVISVSVLCALSGASGTQMPESGLFEMKSGPYTVTLLPNRACALSGFAWEDVQMFVSPSTPGGSVVQPAKGAEKLISAELEADGSKIARAVSPVEGKKVAFTKVTELGGIRLKTVMTLTETGLVYSVDYEIVSEEKPSYFYPLTMPWCTAFGEWFMTTASGTSSGKLISNGAWVMNADLSAYALYRADKGIGIATGVKTPIPTVMRRHTVWDHKAYHKYFLFHKIPEWKTGYRSPVYSMEFRAFRAVSGEWKKQALEVMKEMGTEKTATQAEVRKENRIEILEPGPVSARSNWKNPRRGIEALDPDHVLPPFTPVHAEGTTASVWNRTYCISELGLLDKAEIAGKDILEAPMTFSLVADGKEIRFRNNPVRLVEARKGRAVFGARGKSELISLEAKTTIEYDGMVRVDLTLTPRSEITINHLEYGFSLPEKNALYMHFIGCRPNHNAQFLSRGPFYRGFNRLFRGVPSVFDRTENHARILRAAVLLKASIGCRQNFVDGLCANFFAKLGIIRG